MDVRRAITLPGASPVRFAISATPASATMTVVGGRLSGLHQRRIVRDPTSSMIAALVWLMSSISNSVRIMACLPRMGGYVVDQKAARGIILRLREIVSVECGDLLLKPHHRCDGVARNIAKIDEKTAKLPVDGLDRALEPPALRSDFVIGDRQKDGHRGLPFSCPAIAAVANLMGHIGLSVNSLFPFDPAKRDSADLLAGMAGLSGLGLLGATQYEPAP